MKVITKDGRIVTLDELFKGKEETRKEIAKLPFEEKIKHLIELQKLAKTWGNIKDVFVWEVSTDIRDEKEGQRGG